MAQHGQEFILAPVRHTQRFLRFRQLCRAFIDSAFQVRVGGLQFSLRGVLLRNLGSQFPICEFLLLLRACQVIDQIDIGETQPERFGDCRMQTLRDHSHHDDVNHEHHGHRHMEFAPGDRQMDSIRQQGRDHEYKVGAPHGGQRGHGSSHHSHQDEREKNLVDVTQRREKEKARKTPQQTVDGNAIKILSPPAAGVRLFERRSKVSSAVAVSPQRQQKNDQEPAQQERLRNLFPQHGN